MQSDISTSESNTKSSSTSTSSSTINNNIVSNSAQCEIRVSIAYAYSVKPEGEILRLLFDDFFSHIDFLTKSQAYSVKYLYSFSGSVLFSIQYPSSKPAWLMQEEFSTKVAYRSLEAARSQVSNQVVIPLIITSSSIKFGLDICGNEGSWISFPTLIPVMPLLNQSSFYVRI